MLSCSIFWKICPRNFRCVCLFCKGCTDVAHNLSQGCCLVVQDSACCNEMWLTRVWISTFYGKCFSNLLLVLFLWDVLITVITYRINRILFGFFAFLVFSFQYWSSSWRILCFFQSGGHTVSFKVNAWRCYSLLPEEGVISVCAVALPRPG